MESLFLKRSPGSTTFDRRRLKRIQDLSRDQIHALIDKVEIASNFSQERRKNKKLLRFFAIITFVLLVLTICAASQQNNSIRGQSNYELALQDMATNMTKNASITNVKYLLNRSESLKSKLNNLESNKDGFGHSTSIMDLLLDNLDKKTTLPLILIVLIVWLVMFPLVMLAKYQEDQRQAYKKVSNLLSIENETYFCKRGYFWSTDHRVLRLKLTQTHSATLTEVTAKTPVKKVEVKKNGRPSIDSNNQPPPNGFQYIPHPQFMMGAFPMNYGIPYQHPMMFHNQNMTMPMQTPKPRSDEHPKNEIDKDNSPLNHKQDDLDESQGDETHSRHRSYGRKRKVNPGSGSVDGKLLSTFF